MFKRFCVVCLVLALLAVSAAPALAQESTYCGALAQEDCDLLYQSTEAMSSVTSGNTGTEIFIAAQNLPQAPYPDLQFSLVQQSSFDASDEAVAALAELQALDSAALSALLADGNAFADVFTDIFSGTSMDVSAAISFSQDLAQWLGTQAQTTWPQEVLLNLKLIEGVLYLDLGSLAETIPEAGFLGGGWLGLEMTPLVDQGLRQQSSPTFQTPTGTMSLSSPALSLNLTSNSAGPLFSKLGPLDPQGSLLQYLTVERLPAGEVEVPDLAPVDDEEVAIFSTTINFQDFLASPLFEQLVGQAIASQQGAQPSSEELTQMVGLARLVAPMVLNGVTLELLEAVGVDTGYLYATNFTLDIDITQLLAMASMAGDALPPMDLQTDGPSGIAVHITQITSDLNAETEITTPEGAMVLPAEQLQGLLQQMN